MDGLISKPNAGTKTPVGKMDPDNNRELPEAEVVKDSTSEKGATLRAVKKQAGESFDNMTQSNSGANCSN